ncbi:MAG: hypothetical protein ACP6IS_07800 [Candidatus Asgardarchaeia archaeon]
MELVYIQGIPQKEIEELIRLETFENITFSKDPSLKVLRAHSDVLGELYLQGSWDKKLVMSKEGKIIRTAGEFPVFDVSGEGGLIVLAILALFLLGYIIALVGLWIIGNLFTFGAYRWRKNKYILYIELPKDEQQKNKAIRIIQRINDAIIRRGGYVKTENQNLILDETIAKGKRLYKGYKWFNAGRYILSAVIVLASILEGGKLILEHYMNYAISSETAWLFWRYPLIAFALLGLFLLVFGELKIRNTISSI